MIPTYHVSTCLPYISLLPSILNSQALLEKSRGSSTCQSIHSKHPSCWHIILNRNIAQEWRSSRFSECRATGCLRPHNPHSSRGPVPAIFSDLPYIPFDHNRITDVLFHTSKSYSTNEYEYNRFQSCHSSTVETEGRNNPGGGHWMLSISATESGRITVVIITICPIHFCPHHMCQNSPAGPQSRNAQ